MQTTKADTAGHRCTLSTAIPLTPLKQNSATDNSHMEKLNTGIAKAATENTDEKIEQSTAAPAYLV